MKLEERLGRLRVFTAAVINRYHMEGWPDQVSDMSLGTSDYDCCDLWQMNPEEDFPVYRFWAEVPFANLTTFQVYIKTQFPHDSRQPYGWITFLNNEVVVLEFEIVQNENGLFSYQVGE